MTIEDQIWAIGLDCLDSQIAVLNADGRVERCNRAWSGYALSCQPNDAGWNPGALFLDAFAGRRYPPGVRSSVTAALRAAWLTPGETESVTYPSGYGEAARWYRVNFRSFPVDERSYALVSHEDISTARHLEAQRSQRLADAELQASAAQHTDRAIMILDGEGNIEWVNPAFTQLNGYSFQEVAGRNLLFLCGSDTDAATSKLIERRIRAGVGVDVEILHYTKTGTPLWVRSEIRPVRNAAGFLEHFVALEVDITARKLAAEQLARSHALLHAIVNSVPQYIVWKDCDLVYGGCNQQFARLMGLDSPSEIVGRRASELPLIAEDAERYDRIDREIIAGAAPMMGLREIRRRADGEQRALIMNRLVLRRPDNSISGVLSVSEDVTEAERAAQKVRDDEQRWAMGLEVNDVGVWDFDVNAGTVVGSTHWQELLGGEVNGPTSDFPLPAQRLHADDVARFKAEWDALLSGVLPTLESGVRLRVRGTYRYMRLRARVVKRDEAGYALRVVGTMVDIHDAILRQAQAATATKLESIGQFAAGIAHEITTPIQNIRDHVGFLSGAFTAVRTALDDLNGLIAAAADAIPVHAVRTILDRADISCLRDGIPETIRESSEGIERVARIIGAMREISHPGHERMPSDLNDAIGRAITAASDAWKHVARIETDLDQGLPPVPVMPGEFNQLILDLIVGAVHAIAEKRRAEENFIGTIRILTRRVDGCAEICIADDGCGTTAQAQQKIFDPLVSSEAAEDGADQGLAIAHNLIVEKHHGTIEVSGEVGRGTTCTIRLPLSIDDCVENAA